MPRRNIGLRPGVSPDRALELGRGVRLHVRSGVREPITAQDAERDVPGALMAPLPHLDEQPGKRLLRLALGTRDGSSHLVPATADGVPAGVHPDSP